MRKFFNRRNVLLTLVAIVVLPVLAAVSWLESAPLRGRWAAHSDIAHGRYRVLGYGLPPAGISEYRNLLQQRYGVEYRQVAFCTVGPYTSAYVDAYDAVSGSAIEARFGSDVFKKSWEEADRQFREKHKADIQKVSHSE